MAEMVMADMGSCGLLAPMEEFQMDSDTMAFIILNWVFTLDGLATRLNYIFLWFMSYE